VVVNAAAALVAGARARDFKEGVQQAEHAIDSGAAGRKLQALAETSQRLAPPKVD
jgi:anthranilate phosphoribosyltransferase